MNPVLAIVFMVLCALLILSHTPIMRSNDPFVMIYGMLCVTVLLGIVYKVLQRK